MVKDLFVNLETNIIIESVWFELFVLKRTDTSRCLLIWLVGTAAGDA